MCSSACIQFAGDNLSPNDVRGKNVLEVGARDVNGSVRSAIERLQPARYLGVDIMSGRGVDEICDVNELVNRFGKGRFDVVVSSELLEHVRDWRSGITNLKNVLTDGGLLLLTTRSRGCPYHGYPFDFWRYEVADMRAIFDDFTIQKLESDPDSPGVFLIARKPVPFEERNLDTHALWSIVSRRRCGTVSDSEVRSFTVKYRLWRRLVALAPMAARRKISALIRNRKSC